MKNGAGSASLATFQELLNLTAAFSHLLADLLSLATSRVINLIFHLKKHYRATTAILLPFCIQAMFFRLNKSKTLMFV
jgi:hypothetical protein